MAMPCFSKLLFPASLYEPRVQLKLFFQVHVDNLLAQIFFKDIPSYWRALFYYKSLSIKYTYVHISYIPYILG